MNELKKDAALHTTHEVRLFVTLNHGPLNKVAKDCPCLNTKIVLLFFFFF